MIGSLELLGRYHLVQFNFIRLFNYRKMYLQKWFYFHGQLGMSTVKSVSPIGIPKQKSLIKSETVESK